MEAINMKVIVDEVYALGTKTVESLMSSVAKTSFARKPEMVFCKVYKIDLKNDIEFVFIAISTPPDDSTDEEDDSLNEKLKSLRLSFTLEEVLDT
ncbi:hypothetical protein L1987_34883 [Smallanthus sonchifolius]|uniref:Uncharacterized protein n=1 Tax=Smallanthus sonchifolius TaxID=185202 RepID=A0ACB9HUH7_9ASTR|nr:hypothetical protein L1987_34883 [Smallanthus sonchifolius]